MILLADSNGPDQTAGMHMLKDMFSHGAAHLDNYLGQTNFRKYITRQYLDYSDRVVEELGSRTYLEKNLRVEIIRYG